MGHTVLAVPVPPLEDEVRARTAFYDPSFVSADPRFVHAHITVLAPWVTSPTEGDLAAVGEIAATIASFEVRFRRVAAFENDGVFHLPPEPDQSFRALTARLTQRFPGYPPYAGEFPAPVPHLTLDHPAGGVTLEQVRARVAHLLPVAFTARRLDLQWWGNHECRLLRSWPLGEPPSSRPVRPGAS